MLMANAKKKEGIILLSIGLIFVISGVFLISRSSSYLYFAGLPIIGVVLFVIGLILLIASRKNAKKIVGIVILVIGSIFLVFIYFLIYIFASQGWGLSPAGFFWTIFIGVVCFSPGLVLLLTSRKKNSKSPDKSITK